MRQLALSKSVASLHYLAMASVDKDSDHFDKTRARVQKLATSTAFLSTSLVSMKNHKLYSSNNVMQVKKELLARGRYLGAFIADLLTLVEKVIIAVASVAYFIIKIPFTREFDVELLKDQARALISTGIALRISGTGIVSPKAAIDHTYRTWMKILSFKSKENEEAIVAFAKSYLSNINQKLITGELDDVVEKFLQMKNLLDSRKALANQLKARSEEIQSEFDRLLEDSRGMMKQLFENLHNEETVRDFSSNDPLVSHMTPYVIASLERQMGFVTQEIYELALDKTVNRMNSIVGFLNDDPQLLSLEQMLDVDNVNSVETLRAHLSKILVAKAEEMQNLDDVQSLFKDILEFVNPNNEGSAIGSLVEILPLDHPAFEAIENQFGRLFGSGPFVTTTLVNLKNIQTLKYSQPGILNTIERVVKTRLRYLESLGTSLLHTLILLAFLPIMYFALGGEGYYNAIYYALIALANSLVGLISPEKAIDLHMEIWTQAANMVLESADDQTLAMIHREHERIQTGLDTLAKLNQGMINQYDNLIAINGDSTDDKTRVVADLKTELNAFRINLDVFIVDNIAVLEKLLREKSTRPILNAIDSRDPTGPLLDGLTELAIKEMKDHLVHMLVGYKENILVEFEDVINEIECSDSPVLDADMIVKLQTHRQKLIELDQLLNSREQLSSQIRNIKSLRQMAPLV